MWIGVSRREIDRYKCTFVYVRSSPLVAACLRGDTIPPLLLYSSTFRQSHSAENSFVKRERERKRDIYRSFSADVVRSTDSSVRRYLAVTKRDAVATYARVMSFGKEDCGFEATTMAQDPIKRDLRLAKALLIASAYVSFQFSLSRSDLYPPARIVRQVI